MHSPTCQLENLPDSLFRTECGDNTSCQRELRQTHRLFSEGTPIRVAHGAKELGQ